MFDLDKKGSLHEVGVEYEIHKNTKVLIAVNKIFNNRNISVNIVPTYPRLPVTNIFFKPIIIFLKVYSILIGFFY